MTHTTAIVRIRPAAAGMDIDSFAAATRLHPDLVRRFVALGLLDAYTDSAGHTMLRRSDIARVARIQRLRAGFGLNYAATGLVLDLLDRLDARIRNSVGGTSWTSTD